MKLQKIALTTCATLLMATSAIGAEMRGTTASSAHARRLLQQAVETNDADADSQARDWLGRAVENGAFHFWTKNASGYYTAVNDYFVKSFSLDSYADVVGKTDAELIVLVAGDRTIEDFQDAQPDETLESIASAYREHDLMVQETGRATRFNERVIAGDRVYDVIAIKAPFEGGTVGIGIPRNAEDDINVVIAKESDDDDDDDDDESDDDDDESDDDESDDD